VRAAIVTTCGFSRRSRQLNSAGLAVAIAQASPEAPSRRRRVVRPPPAEAVSNSSASIRCSADSSSGSRDAIPNARTRVRA
jgi:hypothetical protein